MKHARQTGKCIQGSNPISESKFPDYSLTGGQNTHFFPDHRFTYLQKEVRKMEPNRNVMYTYLLFHNAK